MAQDTLTQLRARMRETEPTDKAELVRLWRSAYVDVPQFALHRMHALAFEHGIAKATAGDWNDEEGIDAHEPTISQDGQVLPEFGLTRTVYFRGYAISTRVDPLRGAWRSSSRVEEDDGSVIFDESEEGFPTIAEAYSAAVNRAIDAIAGVAA